MTAKDLRKGGQQHVKSAKRSARVGQPQRRRLGLGQFVRIVEQAFKSRPDGVAQDVHAHQRHTEPLAIHVSLPIGYTDDAVPQGQARRIGKRRHCGLIVGMLGPKSDGGHPRNRFANFAWTESRGPIQHHHDGIGRLEEVFRNRSIRQAPDTINHAGIPGGGQGSDGMAPPGECSRQIAKRGLRATQRALERRCHIVIPLDRVEENPIHKPIACKCTLSTWIGQSRITKRATRFTNRDA